MQPGVITVVEFVEFPNIVDTPYPKVIVNLTLKKILEILNETLRHFTISLFHKPMKKRNDFYRLQY